MLRLIASCVITLAILSDSTAALAANGGIVKGALNLLKESAKESVLGAANAVGQEAGRRLADRLFDNDIPRRVVILRELDAIELVAGVYQYEIQKLKEAIDEKVSRKTFIALMDVTIARISEHEYRLNQIEARASRFEADLERQSGRITDLSKHLYSVRKEVGELERHVEQMNKRFELELAQIASGLAEEKAERRAIDLQLATAIQINDQKTMALLKEHGDEISRLKHHISPETRSKTASFLGADGASLIISGGDPIEAIRTLRLSVAYDKNANLHPDPGSRYFLAVAYKRAGERQRAEEILAEAIVAERFRTLPGWWRHIIEKFYGEDRLWVEAARQDRRYGVRAPRAVEHLQDGDQVPKPNTKETTTSGS